MASEVRAYRFILNQLIDKKGWNKENVYCQQECHKIKALKEGLMTEKGIKRPENTVKITENIYYFIEAKNKRKKLDLALQDAQEKSKPINEVGKVKILFITGIAGDDSEGFIAKSQYYKNGTWRTITDNGVEVTGLLSKNQIDKILETKNYKIKDVEITEKEFLHVAEHINGILHENSINKDYRARFISAILLTMSDGSKIDVEEKDVGVLISTINAKATSILHKHKKQDFSRFIKIDMPSNSSNHQRVRAAIIKTYEELLGLNIRSAMKSGKDILGKFYEVFLKYGNGAKEIGIVLTPRNITKFAAEVTDITIIDLVLDITCGTGGFLVAAFDEVRKKCITKKDFADFDIFKNYGLYGIEDQDPVIALAIVNMIFRGDGKNNIIEGDCFSKWLTIDKSRNFLSCKYLDKNKSNRIPPITKVLMNPPFAQKGDENKEYKFINHALEQMQNEGVLFSVLPISVLMEKQTKQWRKDLLKENTLLSVITFPKDLFYPTGIHTVGIFIKKGIPHHHDQNVFWSRILNDGYLKVKGRRILSKETPNELLKIKNILKSFIKDQTIDVENIPEFQKAAPIDFSDEIMELVPEAYLDGEIPTIDRIESNLDVTLRELIAYMIISNKTKDFKTLIISNSIIDKKLKEMKEMYITDIFKVPIITGMFHVSGILDDGNIPLISCSSFNSGVEKYVDVDDFIIKKSRRVEKTFPLTYKHAITIASDGKPLTTFYHYYKFCAKDNVMVCFPKDNLRPTTMIFIVNQLNMLQWRFSYGRKCYLNKSHKLKIFLPMINDKIDEDYIEYLIKKLPSWKILMRIIKYKA